MGIMDLRRSLLMKINGIIPTNMSVDEITVTSGETKTFQHSLGVPPDSIILFPKTQPAGTGAANSYMIYGAKLGGGGYGNCPYKLIRNFCTATNNWDYSGSNSGWDADDQNVYLSFNYSSAIDDGDYILVAYKYGQ
jgi:hypothetical protein